MFFAFIIGLLSLCIQCSRALSECESKCEVYVLTNSLQNTHPKATYMHMLVQSVYAYGSLIRAGGRPSFFLM
jgi:hypothetical protein